MVSNLDVPQLHDKSQGKGQEFAAEQLCLLMSATLSANEEAAGFWISHRRPVIGDPVRTRALC